IGSFTIPEWCRMVLGIRPVVSSQVATTAQCDPWTWQLQCVELKGIGPIDFPGQWRGVGDAANSEVMSIDHQFFPLNIGSIAGGEVVTFYVTAEQIMTGAADAYATVWYGESGDQLPSSYDPLPGVQRYGMMGPITASGAAQARATAAANIQVIGGFALTEEYGCIGGNAAAAAGGDCLSGIFELQSSAFAASPIRYGSRGTACGWLGAGVEVGHVKMTREPLYMTIDRYCVIEQHFNSDTTAVATDQWQVGVQFIRPGEG
ncbi:unnamed protein product, partial [marine sediment metagenome]